MENNLQDKLEELLKAVKEAKKRKMPAVPPVVETDEHPSKLSEKAALSLVKEEHKGVDKLEDAQKKVPQTKDPNKHQGVVYEKESKRPKRLPKEDMTIAPPKEVMKTDANGQWKLEKDVNQSYSPKPNEM